MLHVVSHVKKRKATRREKGNKNIQIYLSEFLYICILYEIFICYLYKVTKYCEYKF